MNTKVEITSILILILREFYENLTRINTLKTNKTLKLKHFWWKILYYVSSVT